MDPGVTLYPLDSHALADKYRKQAVNTGTDCPEVQDLVGRETPEGHVTALINQVQGDHPSPDPFLHPSGFQELFNNLPRHFTRHEQK